MPRVGLISDTHGLLRPEALAFLRGSDHIIHAGDVGSESILRELAAIAPTSAVRGNNDTQAWAASLPETQLLTLGGVRIYVIHELARLSIDPAASGVRIVVCGHSHQPRIDERGGIFYVNPGSAGPRRFRLPIALGEIRTARGGITPRIVELERRAPPP
jgi:uncharacterized protein